MTAPETQAFVGLDQLHPSDDNVRNTLNPDTIDELAASIRADGILSPLSVCYMPDSGPDAKAPQYEIIAGHRRHAALTQLAEELPDVASRIPVLIKARPANITAARLAENLQREDLTVLEEAAGYAALRNQGMSQTAIARAVGKSQPHISKRLTVWDKLQPDARTLLTEADEVGNPLLTINQAVELARLSPAAQSTAIAMIRAGEKVVRAINGAETDDRYRGEREQVARMLTENSYQQIEVGTDWNGIVDLPLPLVYIGMPIDLPTGPTERAAAHDGLPCDGWVIRPGRPLPVADMFSRWAVQVCTHPEGHQETPEDRATRLADHKARYADEQAALDRATRARTQQIADRQAFVLTLAAGKPDDWDAYSGHSEAIERLEQVCSADVEPVPVAPGEVVALATALDSALTIAARDIDDVTLLERMAAESLLAGMTNPRTASRWRYGMRLLADHIADATGQASEARRALLLDHLSDRGWASTDGSEELTKATADLLDDFFGPAETTDDPEASIPVDDELAQIA